jgi:FecR-like protein
MLGRSGHVHLRVAALLLCASASVGAQTGIITVTEGSIELVRGTTTYSVAPGVSLHAGDMLALGPKGQAQIEFDDGSIINLSRGARAMLISAQAQSGEPSVALKSGWAKFTRAKAPKGKPFRYITPLVRLSTAGGTGVLRPGEDASELFLESGAGRIVELSGAGAPGGGRDLKGGEFAVRRAGQLLAASTRPSQDFLKNMPAHFRDDLPAFLPRLRNRKIDPVREHEATYAEVETWLKASLPIRRGLAERFHGRAKDPQFRAKLIENLAAHPEWDRILFPEKYEKEQERTEKEEKEKGR